jgi:hypothetical protein
MIMIADVVAVPWYANPVFLPAASGLFGVIVGGLIASASNYFIAERRARHDEEKDARLTRTSFLRAARLVDEAFRGAVGLLELDIRDKTRAVFPHNPIIIDRWNSNCGDIAPQVSAEVWDALCDAMLVMQQLHSFYGQPPALEKLDNVTVTMLQKSRDELNRARTALQPLLHNSPVVVHRAASRADLRSGFFRVMVVLSLLVGLVVVTVVGRPSLSEFRWRQPTAAETVKAWEWEKKGAQPFDPDMYLITNGGKVQKNNQSIVPVLYTLRYFVLPFALALLAVWLMYFAIRFVVVGFIGRGLRSNALGDRAPPSTA